ncbi:MAG: alpha/beta fold hydrolase [Acidimicrobiales bacterium]
MDMVEVDGVELCYELAGNAADPLIVLVNGLGRPHVSWDRPFVELLVEEGFAVLVFDNRDCGRSTRFDDSPPFDLAAAARRDRSVVRYTLDDMADDLASLLRALGLGPANLVGVSMGGMIAQTLTIRHPELVTSLCSIMSTTGARDKGVPSEAALPMLTTAAPTDRDGFVEHELANYRIIGSEPPLRDEAWQRAVFERLWDYGRYPAGLGRQLMAIVASGDRTEQLRSVDVPTVVIHGTIDELVTPNGGEATADAIRGARLVMIEHMGHELPPAVWPRVVAEIVTNCELADGRTAVDRRTARPERTETVER